jgi:hypothetical protein
MLLVFWRLAHHIPQMGIDILAGPVIHKAMILGWTRCAGHHWQPPWRSSANLSSTFKGRRVRYASRHFELSVQCRVRERRYSGRTPKTCSDINLACYTGETYSPVHRLMSHFRISLNLFPVVAGLVIAGFLLLRAEPVAALCCVVCGCAISMVLWSGSPTILASPEYLLVTGVATIIGLAATFSSGALFKSDLQGAYFNAMTSFAELNMFCTTSTPKLRQVAEAGVAACALQSDRDATAATIELQKGIHFGPALTLADNAATIASGAQVNQCAKAFKEAVGLCPIAFSSINEKQRSALLSAAE